LRALHTETALSMHALLDRHDACGHGSKRRGCAPGKAERVAERKSAPCASSSVYQIDLGSVYN
jgi:hypothetical protein